MGFQAEQRVQNVANQMMMVPDAHDEGVGHGIYHFFKGILGPYGGEIIIGFALIGGYWVFRKKLKDFFSGLFK